MTSKRSRTVNIQPPTEADDFKLIRGIGPAIEGRLHHTGILTYAQLAALSAKQVMGLLTNVAGLSIERVHQQAWIEQAQELASRQGHDVPQNDAAASENRLHYATFAVELLLDKENKVRRTRVVHVQTGDENTWAGWEEVRLVGFLTQRAELCLPPAGPIPSLLVRTGLAGVLRLSDLETLPTDADSPRGRLYSGQPFQARLTLDLQDVQAPPDIPLAYTVTVYAKSLGGGPRQIVGEAHGIATPMDKLRVNMNVQDTMLPQDIYRLEADAALSLPSAGLAASDSLMASSSGRLLLVY